MKRIAWMVIFVAGGLLLIRLGLTAFAADETPSAASNGGSPPASSPPAGSPVQKSVPHGRGAPVSAVAPSTPGRALPLPRQYMILMTRSMFVRGHVAEAGHVGGHNIPAPTTEPSLVREETNLVFNGVTQTDKAIDALVEDTGSGRVLTVRSGDTVAKGTVGKITMDSLEYIRPSGATTIHIGQNFSGGETDLSVVPTTNTPAGSGASPQDILERLRQKRLQELGGH